MEPLIEKSETPTSHSTPAFVIFFSLWGILGFLACSKYYSLHSTYYDLGTFLLQFDNIASGQWSRIFTGHIQPLMLAWAWLYKFFPIDLFPYLLLSFQAAALVWPVVELYRHFGVIPAIIFALYFPLWYNALFDFHMDHLAVPLLFGFFFQVKRGNIRMAVFLALLLALLKEPFALQTVACGVYLLLFPRYRLEGAILMVVSLLYFIVTNKYILPYFSLGFTGALGSSDFAWLGNGMGEMLWFIVTHPLTVLDEIFFHEGKIRYLYYLFGALGFIIPFLRPASMIVALPVFAIALLSQYNGHHGLYYHYTAGLIAPLIFAFSQGLPVARRIWEKLKLPVNAFTAILIAGIIVIHFQIAPSPISRKFWNPEATNHYYNLYIPTDREEMIKTALKNFIPKDPNVVITTQNSLNWAHLAARNFYFSFPQGVFATHKMPELSVYSFQGFWKFMLKENKNNEIYKNVMADYVVLDLKRPPYLVDKGCHWVDGKCRNKKEFVAEFENLVIRTREEYLTVFSEDDFYIFKRRKEKEDT